MDCYFGYGIWVFFEELVVDCFVVLIVVVDEELFYVGEFGC